jgi:signal peptidase I
MTPEKNKPRKRRNPRRMEMIKAAVVVILIGLVLRIFVFLPFKMKTPNMENSLFQGDFLLASQLSYRTGSPQPGDLIVFNHPFKVDEATAARVVAIEGQTVEIIDKVVYVDHQPLENSDKVKFTDNRIIPPVYSNRDYVEPTEVPAGAVYVLSDNRDEGEDSRNFGFINVDSIKGKGLFVYWSWRPDPDAPRMESPYITPAIKILFYNLFHFPSRIGWDRIGAGIK